MLGFNEEQHILDSIKVIGKISSIKFNLLHKPSFRRSVITESSDPIILTNAFVQKILKTLSIVSLIHLLDKSYVKEVIVNNIQKKYSNTEVLQIFREAIELNEEIKLKKNHSRKLQLNLIMNLT